jgi:hypothetical protein
MSIASDGLIEADSHECFFPYEEIEGSEPLVWVLGPIAGRSALVGPFFIGIA